MSRIEDAPGLDVPHADVPGADAPRLDASALDAPDADGGGGAEVIGTVGPYAAMHLGDHAVYSIDMAEGDYGIHYNGGASAPGRAPTTMVAGGTAVRTPG